jgi:hypothetical protein
MNFDAPDTALARSISTEEACVLETIESWFVNRDFTFVTHGRCITIESAKASIYVIVLSATKEMAKLFFATSPATDVPIPLFAAAIMAAAPQAQLDLSLLERGNRCMVFRQYIDRHEFSMQAFRSVFNRFVTCVDSGLEKATLADQSVQR